jgi:hypothetical protein
MVWTGLLKTLLEVVHRRPHWMLVVAHSSRDTPHAGATCLPVVVVITAGHGHSPLKALFAPLVAAFDTLLCRVKHGRLVASGVLGGNATWLLKRAPEKVIMSALPRALHVVWARYPGVLRVNLWFTMLSLPLPLWGLG